MQKYLLTVLSILLIWGSSCDHEDAKFQQVATEKKIVITDLEHEPAVKDLLLKIKGRSANGRASSLEVADAFFKYSEPDSGILNYTFRLPDDSPDYFENLVLSQYEDGFYGFIYRYIPDGPYIAGDSFTGTFQQYNLTGDLITELTIPTVQDSVSAGGRVQLMNQCVKSIEQTCTTIYEVETRTDYPCHCQYDHKTVVSSVCTFSFNRGWCDDMIAVPPAGGGGTYVGSSDAAPRSGGLGGSTSAPKPVKNPVVVVPEPGFDDITFNNVKSPCLVRVIKNLMRKDFKNKINQNAKHWFVDAEQAQNLNFKEINTLLNDENYPIHAHTSSAYTTPGKIQNVDITLNSSTLPGTSELFQIVAIYHETLHAILNMSTTYQKMLPKEKHEFMSSSSRTQVMIDALTEVYNRDLTPQEVQKVAALWLYSFSDAIATSNFQTSMDKWKLTNDNILKIGEEEERIVKIAVNGETKIKSIGGPNCNND
jgi:hypothetical protein